MRPYEPKQKIPCGRRPGVSHSNVVILNHRSSSSNKVARCCSGVSVKKQLTVCKELYKKKIMCSFSFHSEAKRLRSIDGAGIQSNKAIDRTSQCRQRDNRPSKDRWIFVLSSPGLEPHFHTLLSSETP